MKHTRMISPMIKIRLRNKCSKTLSQKMRKNRQKLLVLHCQEDGQIKTVTKFRIENCTLMS